jgi:hypothetical protein
MVDDKRRAELERLAALPEDQQDAYLIENVPPHEREQFIRDLQEVAAEEEGFLAEALDVVLGRWRAGERAERLSQRAIADASADDVEFVKVAGSPNANYMNIPHEKLKSWSVENNDPSSVGQIAAYYTKMQSAYDRIHGSVTKAVSVLRGSWEGDAGEAAASYGDQLAKYSEASAKNAKLAAEVVAAQADTSEGFKNAMPEPIPFSWENEMARARSEGNPFEAIKIVSEAMEKQEKSQKAHEQAAQVAANFEKSTYTTVSKAPVFAEPPKFDASGDGGGSDKGGGGDSGKSVSNIGNGHTGTGSPRTGPSSSSRDRSGSPSGRIDPPKTGTNRPNDGGSSNTGGVRLPDGSTRLPDGSTRLPDGTIVKPDGTRVLPDGTKILPDGTRILPDGRVIPPGNTRAAGLDSGSSTGFGRPGSGGGLGGSTSYGSPGGVGGPGAGAGAATGFGPVGGGAAAGAGGFGPGKGSGAVPLGGGSGAGGAAAAKAGPGAGMGRGMGGMMGGAGAGRGQGAEDKEHQDQYYIKQEMDPGLQVEYDEHGEKIVDETTGMTVVPSVIGE